MRRDWNELLEKLYERDKNDVDDYHKSPLAGTIEGKLALANNRATDALYFIVEILKYLRDKELAKAEGEDATR